MDKTLQLFYIILGCLWIFAIAGFTVSSYKENENKATKISFLITLTSMAAFGLSFRLSLQTQIYIVYCFLVITLLILILFLLPIGKVKINNTTPKNRFDERDIMFARARLKPGSKIYNRYYKMRPENKAKDDLTRQKPGLLSPNAKYSNPIINSSPIASFRLTDAFQPVVEGQPNPIQKVLSKDKMTEFITGLTKYFGALDVGITELKPYHVYSNIGRGPGEWGSEIPIEHKYAIAFTVEMDHEMIGANPLPLGVMESAKQYVEAGRVAVQLTQAILELGYPARAHIDGNYRVICPVVAQDAGLGDIGRMGLLMTPKQGPRVRIAVVTTDLELLPTPKRPLAATIDFCNICMKCAENCPSRSISFDDQEKFDGIFRWRIDPESCFMYWNIIGTDCGVCMTVCPFSHPDTIYHNFVRWGIQRSGFFRRIALLLDDLFYGKKPEKKSPPTWADV